MAAKEDLIHDINIVTTLSSRQDMSDPSCAQKYLNYYEQNKVFKTGVGHHYLERLKQISADLKPDTCFACKKNKAFDGILCEACMHKYTRGTKHFYKAPEQDAFSSLDEVFTDDHQEESLGSNISGTINNAGTSNLSSRSNSNDSQVNSFNPKDYSAAGKAAVVLSIFPTFPIGFILALIDLSKKDGRKHGNAKAAIVLTCIWIIGIAGVVAYDTIVKPPSTITTESNKNINSNDSISNNNTTNSNNTSGNNGNKSANIDPQIEVYYTQYSKTLQEKYNKALSYLKSINLHTAAGQKKGLDYIDSISILDYANSYFKNVADEGLALKAGFNECGNRLIGEAINYQKELMSYYESNRSLR